MLYWKYADSPHLTNLVGKLKLIPIVDLPDAYGFMYQPPENTVAVLSWSI